MHLSKDQKYKIILIIENESCLTDLSEKIPNNNIVKDILFKFRIPKKFKLDFKNKKDMEILDFFNLNGKNKFGDELSFEEVLFQYEKIEDERNSGWDLLNKENKELIEITSIHRAGSIENKIKNKYDTKTKPIFENNEIYNEAKKVIEKKLKKRGIFDYHHRIIISISAFDEENPAISDLITRGSKFRKIDNYHNLLKKHQEENYMNFQEREIIFVYGVCNSSARIYGVNKYMIDFNFKKIKNMNTIFNSVIVDKSNSMKEEWDIYRKRIFDIEKNNKN